MRKPHPDQFRVRLYISNLNYEYEDIFSFLDSCKNIQFYNKSAISKLKTNYEFKKLDLHRKAMAQSLYDQAVEYYKSNEYAGFL